jgi:hypothetical protein
VRADANQRQQSTVVLAADRLGHWHGHAEHDFGSGQSGLIGTSAQPLVSCAMQRLFVYRTIAWGTSMDDLDAPSSVTDGSRASMGFTYAFHGLDRHGSLPK